MNELIALLSKYTEITFYNSPKELHLYRYPEGNVKGFYNCLTDSIYVNTNSAHGVSIVLHHEFGHLLYKYGLLNKDDVPVTFQERVCKVWLSNYEERLRHEESVVQSFAYWSSSDDPDFTFFFELALTRLTKAKTNLHYLFNKTQECLGFSIDDDEVYCQAISNLKHKIAQTNRKVYSGSLSADKAAIYLESIPAKLAEFIRPLF